MKPKLPSLFLALLAVFCGCAAPNSTQTQGKSLALAVRVIGGGRVSAQQLSWIHSSAADDIARRGYRFATSIDSADYVANINFWPDPLDATSGRIEIASIEPNTRAADYRAQHEKLWESESAKERQIVREPPVDRDSSEK